MANNINSVNFLPEYFQTDTNNKFLSSTLDQLIQPAQLERLNAFVGSIDTPTYNSTSDVYVSNGSQPYQLDPALITRDILGNITYAEGYDDLINEISSKGGLVNNLDRLFRSDVFSFNAHIDWDKLVNYENYFWLPSGPTPLSVPTDNFDPYMLIGQQHGSVTVASSTGTVIINLSNGMLLQFTGSGVNAEWVDDSFFVEGVGTSIQLISLNLLSKTTSLKNSSLDLFDTTPFELYPFETYQLNYASTLASSKPEYITINRASKDLNPWARYNRWVHKDIIKQSDVINGITVDYSNVVRAQRPIIEFKPNIKLINFGSNQIAPVDIFDETVTDINTIIGSTSTIFVNGVELVKGQRIIFGASLAPNAIFQVTVTTDGFTNVIGLTPVYDPRPGDAVISLYGNVNAGKDWYFDGNVWQPAQQKLTLNQTPLFDLFDSNGNSYSDKTQYLSSFQGTKIFSYTVGTSPVDPYLGFPISYRNVQLIGSIQFDNNLCTDSIVISAVGTPSYTISANSAYININGQLQNAWTRTVEYPIPILHSTATGISNYYEEPLSLTNNPLNGLIKQFTISELAEHVDSMIARIPGYNLSSSNLRDQPDFTSYGTKLISNQNPISFSQMFIGKKENSLIDAITQSAEKYNRFKLSFINELNNVDQTLTPAAAVDQALYNIFGSNKQIGPYYYSDMIAYGTPLQSRQYVISSDPITEFPLNLNFDLIKLSSYSVLIYVNGNQLVYGKDYTFNSINESVVISYTLNLGDTITINVYNTIPCFVPPTPSKLGIYPKFQPSLYLDDTFAVPVNVIQGHDGSITVAYNDYRDAIILEFEKRIFNNIKSSYNSNLFDIDSVFPSEFVSTDYSIDEINEILEGDFVKWATQYGIDYVSNNTFDPANWKTWNYDNSYQSTLQYIVEGSWRANFLKLYDTDRPHTHPWEMLGFSIEPAWWTTQYGTNFGSNNSSMWMDLETGTVRDPSGTYVKSRYIRSGLHNIIPVDSSGNLKSFASFVNNLTVANEISSWQFGDYGPAETAWRRSSYYPFAVQRLLSLTKPADYASLLYNPSGLSLNIENQWVYGNQETFPNFDNLPIFGENQTLTNGYSVFVSEIGSQKNSNYISNLRQDLNYVTYNLFLKMNGFVDKNTLEIIIDAYEPTSTAPGAILPSQNYNLILNTGNPIDSIGLSGFIIQKSNNQYIVRGYDTQQAYFTIYKPIRNIGTPSITVGGKSASYVVWQPSGTGGSTGLSAIETTTANSAPTGNFYKQGQIVFYGNSYYRVTVSHQSGSTFNSDFFQILSGLPTTGGVTVQIAQTYETVTTTIPYGTAFSNVQDVYDVIVGYGQWLTSQGFVFETYNQDLQTTSNWDLTTREFLFWVSQNWANGSVITLSPFADQLTLQTENSVVDNLLDSFTTYSVLRADGTAFPKEDLNVGRIGNTFTLSTLPQTDGIYFVRLNLVQKQHAIVFDNQTIFGDVIYDVETGTRQRRMKLVGFRTAGWTGDYTIPGFLYDTAIVVDWAPNNTYYIGSTVRFNGNYYSANQNILNDSTFDFTKWDILQNKPTPGLLPNFDYKINQFEDFYSLDVDNFDSNQQKLGQHLTGYTPRVYLNNIIVDPVAQYKFYQGFIKDKGTKNSIDRLAKASLSTLNGQVTFNEEWAFRVSNFGSFPSYKEIEFPLVEGTFVENPQIISLVDSVPFQSNRDLISYITPDQLSIEPDDFQSSSTFVTTGTEDVLLLLHSGYVRLDDVTATAYNENSLLDIANSDQLNNGDTIWLGFKQDGTWDVYRYTYNPALIIGVYVSSPVSTITFTTEYPHNLAIGDIIGIKQFNTQVNGIYIVTDIPSSTQFTVPSTLASIENAPLVSPGQLFVFESARVTDFDNLPSDQQLYVYPYGTKFWLDSNGDNGWQVYEKIDNFTGTFYLNPAYPPAPGLGQSISKRAGDDVIVVGGVTYYANSQYGVIYVYDRLNGSVENIVRYNIGTEYNNVETGFGSAVFYDDIPFTGSKYGLIFAGAPEAESGNGVVKVSSIDSNFLQEGASTFIKNPSTSVANFGSSIFVQRNVTDKLVCIGGQNGVWSFTVSDNAGTIVVNTGTLFESINSSNINYSVVGTDDASIIAVSNNLFVKIYDKSLNKIQTIKSTVHSFGKSLTIAPDGSYLFVGAPASINVDGSVGSVEIFKNINGSFVSTGTLFNPVLGSQMSFGTAIAVNSQTNQLVVSAVGVNSTFDTIFDDDNTLFDNSLTYFIGTENNSGSAYYYIRQNDRFVLGQQISPDYISTISGINFGISVVIEDQTVFVGMPSNNNTTTNCGFWQFDQIDPTTDSLSLIRQQTEFVDPSSIKKITLINTDKEQVVEFLDVIDPIKGKIAGIADEELTYKLISDPAVYSIGISGVNVDTNKNWLDDHIGELWWDLSTAKYLWYEQSDLQYRANNWGKLFPGATIDVYEWVGSTYLPSEWAALADTPAGLANNISGQPRFSDNSVISVKQIYDTVTNSFSNVYYYWVKNKVIVPQIKNRRISSYAVASVIADPTAYGLTYAAAISSNSVMLSNVGSMLSGSSISLNIAQDTNLDDLWIPRHTEWLLMQENSPTSMPPALLEKKLVDSLIGHDTNGILVPDPSLTDRTRYGIGIRPQQTLFVDRLEALRNVIEFANSILLTVPVTGNYNFSNLKAQEQIPNDSSNEHDQILEDNVELDYVNTATFSRAILNVMVDGVGGISNINVSDAGSGYGTINPVYDNSGNFVGYEGPSFVDIDSSTTFDNNGTTFDVHGNEYANAQDLYGSAYVLDPESLAGNRTTIDAKGANQYGQGLQIETVVDSNGSIISDLIKVTHSGTGYKNNFKLIARPQTIVVQADATVNGNWAIYQFDYQTYSWDRIKTQSYNTTLYWKYVDWASSSFNKYQIISAVVGSPYELSEVSVSEGAYVKINNGGDGRYLIVVKTPSSVQGTYGNGYDLVYSQNGTIQFLDEIWNRSRGNLGWDIATYDEIRYDQTPDKELEYILTAIKDDLFINDLKVNWNLLFFKAVKYALTEQKLLDWAFKTSFISAVNNAGPLNQPPVYKLQSSTYYQNYLEEVKPYKTQIRQFVTDYTQTDHSNSDIIEISTNTSITMKFDRIVDSAQITNLPVTDYFVAPGTTSTFTLSWVPRYDKIHTSVKVGGLLLFSHQWTLNFYSKLYNNYNKLYADLILLDQIPSNGVNISITYNKSPEIQSAADRIVNYYTATNGMIGLDLGMLMYGVDYPGAAIGGQYEGPGFGDSFGGTFPSSDISGGSWQAGISNSALGINPEDIIIDGESEFLSPVSGYAPEELLPSVIRESVGITFHQQGAANPPLVISHKFPTLVNSTNQEFYMDQLPPSVDGMSVILNNALLEYANTTTLAVNQYTIDWQNNYLIIPPQTNNGTLMYSFITIGAGGGNSAFGPIDRQFLFTSDSSVTIFSSIGFGVTQDAYVTVNGVAIESTPTTDTSPYYIFTSGSVLVINLQPGENAIQVWFFAESHKYYDEIRSQYFINSGTTNTFLLSYPPQNDYPLSSRVIVELQTATGTTRLLPPYTEYFTVTNPANTTFQLNKYGLNSSYVRVYKNNTSTTFTSANSSSVTITEPCSVGDSVIVEAYYGSNNFGTYEHNYYDYYINGNLLQISPNVVSKTSSTLKITTFSNNDSLQMQTQRYIGPSANQIYNLDTPIYNTDYIWVTVNKLLPDNETYISYPLINGDDFTVFQGSVENYGIQLSDKWQDLGNLDQIEIITINYPGPFDTVYGYRQFYDMLGGMSYTKLDSANSTYLTRDLYPSDTEIYVNDASVLRAPDVTYNVPGVVLINAERIEFFKLDGNILQEVKRGTLGTGPAPFVKAGTAVVDQSIDQIVGSPFNVHIQNTFTNSTTYIYSISTSSYVGTRPISNSIINNNGITLITTATDMSDQIEIYLGGRKLRKSSSYYVDISVSYDGIDPLNIIGSVPDTSALYSYNNYNTTRGQAYIDSSTNIVYVYDGIRTSLFSLGPLLIANGWVDSGLRYIPPEFTINYNTLTYQTSLVLDNNLSFGDNIQITMVKKDNK